jgi:hypothetical protein
MVSAAAVPGGQTIHFDCDIDNLSLLFCGSHLLCGDKFLLCVK